MLAGVIVGFTPTFYLRSTFFQSPLSGLFIAHGVVLTAWYFLLALQSYLATSRRFLWHRRFGWLGAVLAILIVANTPFVLAHYVPQGLKAGQPVFVVTMIALIDLMRLPYFAVLVTMAIVYRSRQDIHKRALLLASISNFAPAGGRVAIILGGSPMWGAFFLLVFGVALAVHDRRSIGQLHPVTRWGLLVMLLIQIIPMIPAVHSLTRPLIEALR